MKKKKLAWPDLGCCSGRMGGKKNASELNLKKEINKRDKF